MFALLKSLQPSTLSREGFAPNSRVMMLFVSDNGIINCLFTNRINVIMDVTGKPTEMTDLLTPTTEQQCVGMGPPHQLNLVSTN